MSENVYISTAKNWSGHYHTERDCPRLQSAANYRTITLRALNGHREVCSFCADQVDTSKPGTQATCRTCGAVKENGECPFCERMDAILGEG